MAALLNFLRGVGGSIVFVFLVLIIGFYLLALISKTMGNNPIGQFARTIENRAQAQE